jgi:hypothetical protein
MHAIIHNAAKCTIDGRDCWIVGLHDPMGKFIVRPVCVSEHGTEHQAIEAARKMLAGHGHPHGRVYVRRNQNSLREIGNE